MASRRNDQCTIAVQWRTRANGSWSLMFGSTAGIPDRHGSLVHEAGF